MTQIKATPLRMTPEREQQLKDFREQAKADEVERDRTSLDRHIQDLTKRAKEAQASATKIEAQITKIERLRTSYTNLRVPATRTYEYELDAGTKQSCATRP